jgi:hypothetical protein
MKQQVTDYASWTVPLVPWTLSESVQYLAAFLKKGETDSLRMRRLVACCGGIPRILEYLQKAISAVPTNTIPPKELPAYLSTCVGNLSSSLILKIEGLYKVSEWNAKFGSFNNLKFLLACVITQRSVRRDTALPDNATVEDVEKEGVIFLKPASFGAYVVTIPQLILHMLNLANIVFPDINLLDPLSEAWDWNRFEEFEVHFDALKNSFFSLIGSTALLTELYTSNVSQVLQGKSFAVVPVRKINEAQQFLPKEGQAEVMSSIKVIASDGTIGTVQGTALFNFAFK